jgi:hypothetical protein
VIFFFWEFAQIIGVCFMNSAICVGNSLFWHKSYQFERQVDSERRRDPRQDIPYNIPYSHTSSARVVSMEKSAILTGSTPYFWRLLSSCYRVVVDRECKGVKAFREYSDKYARAALIEALVPTIQIYIFISYHKWGYFVISETPQFP